MSHPRPALQASSPDKNSNSERHGKVVFAVNLIWPWQALAFLGNLRSVTSIHPSLRSSLGNRCKKVRKNYFARKVILAFDKSYGDNSTSTLSPGTMRMKCFRIFPEMCASTSAPFCSWTRNMVPGSTSLTTPCVLMASSLPIVCQHCPSKAVNATLRRALV